MKKAKNHEFLSKFSQFKSDTIITCQATAQFEEKSMMFNHSESY